MLTDPAFSSILPACPMRVGEYNTSPLFANRGNIALTLDTLYGLPFPLGRACTLDRIGLRVTVAGGTGAVFRLGLYNDDGTGKPGTLLLDASTVDATAVISREAIISQAASRGLIHVAYVGQGWGAGTAPQTTFNGGTNQLIGTTSLDNAVQGFARSFVHNGTVSGALPATFVVNGAAGNRDVGVVLRASA